MNNALTKNQREYILFHLNQVIDVSSDIRKKIIFDQPKEQHICFFQSKQDLSEPSYIVLEGLPVLFHGDKKKTIYTFENGTLIFHHDLIRAAFYLLSGYQEYKSKRKDGLGRFPYKESIQDRLGIIGRPLVNEYFEIIVKGIQEFCKYHGISFKRRQLFDSFGFFLTHDIDRVDKYTFHSTKNRLKKKNFREMFYFLTKWLNPFDHDNPYWSFDYLLQLEKEYKLTSTFFFLNRGVRHIDSYYNFSQKRIAHLIEHLQQEGCEIGLHGTVRSANDLEVKAKNLDQLNSVIADSVMGNRQHRLTYIHPLTMKNLVKNGIKYDSTLGFASHEGFRHSYCLPYHPYDFKNDKMINIWEIPLIVMDGTLFDYRGLSYDEARHSVENILAEIKRFHGIFTLLWHNSYCDEEAKPGICGFYESLLQMVCDMGGESLRGKDIVERLDAK